MTRKKVKLRSQYDVTHLQPLRNVPTEYQLPTLYGFTSQIFPTQNFKVKVTTARSKVISRSQYDAAHLQPPNNVRTKCRLPTP